MGVLDDAIREHLDLKRKHGAAEEELQRQEEEALGPARRELAADQDQPGAEGADAAAAAGNGAEAEPEAEPAEAVEPDAELDADPAPPTASAEVTPEVADAVPEVVESAPPLDEPGPSPTEEETVLFDAESEPAEAPPAASPSGDTPPRGFAPVETPPSPRSPIRAPHRSTTRSPTSLLPSRSPQRKGTRTRADDDEAGDGDVLEDTPDFLQETPEHDRLWFEQKPPRDFDFD